MINKILVIGLGGTIGSVKTDSIELDKNNLKIMDYCTRNDVQLVGKSPFSVLSENMSIKLWRELIEYLNQINFDNYLGTIILHGSDTLAYTSALIANAYPTKNIILVAADKPIEDSSSNGINNFNNAVNLLCKNGCSKPLVSYNGIYDAACITSANIHDEFVALDSTLAPLNKNVVYDKNILIINPYVGINFDSYCLDDVDTVLISMYHSATVPSTATNFCSRLKKLSIPYYFATHKPSADYETASELDNIIFNCTVENAYARMMLTK